MLYLFIGLLLGVCLTFLYLRPKIHKREQYNTEIIKKNQALEEKHRTLAQEAESAIQENQQLKNEAISLIKENQQLKDEAVSLIKETSDLTEKRNTIIGSITSLQQQAGLLNSNIISLQNQSRSITENIATLQKQAEDSAEQMYQKGIKLASAQMELATEKMSKEYQDAERAAAKEYHEILESLQANIQDEIQEKRIELDEVIAALADRQAKLDAVVEQQKRQLELEQNQDFYRLQLSLLDIEEIKKIRSIIPYLRNAEPVNKVIWKVYYEKPYTDLIGRVIGQGIHTGIYKITNIQNGMCYVGQATDLSARWKQHIRRGVGADPPTRNKLYPAMLELGPENFTFEVLEECKESQLNVKEQEYQKTYHAKDFGYSIK